MFKNIVLTTRQREETIDVTPLIEEVVRESGSKEAGVFVYVPHSDAAINIQGIAQSPSSSNPPLNRLLKKVLEEGQDFQTPEVGAAFVAPTEVLIALEGKLMLGEGQRIYFYEFNGPRQCNLYVLVIPSA
ncbi:YjbQ family protein [Thermatribacter velox]|uniref:YjbQ family protein n=1 Tax=Thermatribacter velox TaxID=3039681 RepID=A0ABZ2YB17_9BACT